MKMKTCKVLLLLCVLCLCLTGCQTEQNAAAPLRQGHRRRAAFAESDG